tara:strand:- start:2073 stop:2321 length:249 start_codon:yes stop_codon:yes gene_type:complete
MGANQMKKVLTVAAAAGLMMLGACQPAAENTTAENMIDSQEANAAMYENMADEATNESTEAMFENAADASEAAADAVEDNAM